jgi:hypothetical protein
MIHIFFPSQRDWKPGIHIHKAMRIKGRGPMVRGLCFSVPAELLRSMARILPAGREQFCVCMYTSDLTPDAQ